MKNLRVQITTLAPVNSGREYETYIANSLADCKADTDRSVYELVRQFGNTITMGSVIGIRVP